MTSKNSAQTPGLHWREWNRPLYEGAAAIADLAELADGFEARRRWEERFWREYTPTLMREMMLDAPFDRWLLDQKPQVDDERMDLARDMYRDFIRKRHELRGTAFRAGMNARMRPGPTADADHPDKIAYIRAVRRIWDHQEDAIAAFDSLLRGTQWEDAWRAYVAKQQHEHPLLYRAPYSTSARP